MSTRSRANVNLSGKSLAKTSTKGQASLKDKLLHNPVTSVMYKGLNKGIGLMDFLIQTPGMMADTVADNFFVILRDATMQRPRMGVRDFGADYRQKLPNVGVPSSMPNYYEPDYPGC